MKKRRKKYKKKETRLILIFCRAFVAPVLPNTRRTADDLRNLIDDIQRQKVQTDLSKNLDGFVYVQLQYLPPNQIFVNISENRDNFGPSMNIFCVIFISRPCTIKKHNWDGRETYLPYCPRALGCVCIHLMCSCLSILQAVRPLKPLVGLIGHSDFVSQESTFFAIGGKGVEAGYFVLCTIFWAR